jgi:CelD/BcsL family acetyltransferase involved in cellulose biosynthesis
MADGAVSEEHRQNGVICARGDLKEWTARFSKRVELKLAKSWQRATSGGEDKEFHTETGCRSKARRTLEEEDRRAGKIGGLPLVQLRTSTEYSVA